ncbi:hypothetical protein Nepgr_003666 [Nepenthes gracilis]|uniref:Integrase catalytic domain-containing protein n=1 Tax=Nepenthes gracilis TaxID=150966 RepID=A0AAD3XE19_NEPGR|nr:hypothetical protein Nepgr_003666 [Nepenthes gracilis]
MVTWPFDHTELHYLQSPWPFAQWGLDILGPLPMAAGQRKFLIVGIDYFTKWVEAVPLAKITEQNATKFLRQGIVCRFGIPEVVVTNNGTQFTGKRFTKLEDAGGSWTEELPSVLWSYRTTAREPTKETLFNLCFGAEAMVPVEMGMPSLRIECFDPATNERRLRESLDLLSEVRDTARLRTAAYQQRVTRYYNKRVNARPLEVGDLVLRSVEAAGKTANRNKLSPGWEGPFLVSAILGSGAS